MPTLNKLIMISENGNVVEMEVANYNEFICEAEELIRNTKETFLKIMFFSFKDQYVSEYGNEEVEAEYHEYVGKN